jgi:hypothetical protein
MDPEDVKGMLFHIRLYAIVLVPTVIILSVLGYAILAMGVVIPLSLICFNTFLGWYWGQGNGGLKTRPLAPSQGNLEWGRALPAPGPAADEGATPPTFPD